MNAERRSRTIGVVCVLAAITAWGAYFPYAKLLLTKIPPATFLVFRLAIGAAVLLLMSLRLGASLTIERRDLPAITAAGAIGIILHQLIQLYGLTHTTATNTGWILTLIPPVTGLLAWIFLKETISLRQVCGLGIAMIGVVEFVSKWHPTQMTFMQNRGDALALASVFTWAVYTIVTKSRLRRYDALPVSAIHMAMGAIFFLIVAAPRIPSDASLLTAEDWFIIALIGIVPSGLAYYWWNEGLKRLSAVNTATFLFVEAIVASVAGFLLLGEVFTVPMLIAAALIVLGVYITQLRRA